MFFTRLRAALFVDYSAGFKEPEMVKPKLAIVLSPPMKGRQGLMTVVALSTTAPEPPKPYHREMEIPFLLPIRWGNIPRWVKGDMVNAVGFHRADLRRLERAGQGRRNYQTSVLSEEAVRRMRACVLHGMGLSILTKHLLSYQIDLVGGSPHAIGIKTSMEVTGWFGRMQFLSQCLIGSRIGGALFFA